MLALYCRDHHAGNSALCAECSQLRDYARQRLDQCPFQEGKTSCAKCPVHCYKPEMRERARAVMRYAGPRMLWRHPILTIRHMLDGRRKEPLRPR
jgi:predicted amidophosphoribosyltransferase